MERLGHIIVGPRLQSLDFAVLIVVHAEHQNGDPRQQTPQFRARFDTALTGHVDIQQHGVIAHHPAQRDGFLSAGGFADIEAQAVEGPVQRAPHRGLVIYNQQFAFGSVGLVHGLAQRWWIEYGSG